MDRDGRNKRDLTAGSKDFTYGFAASPDGKRICYHRAYQVYLADADGSNAQRVETGQPFNFVPQWSPDGQWVLFVSGEHYNCHPHVVHRDGTGLRKLADRNGYRGVVAFLDVPDYHGGSSDVPVWSADGKWVYYTAKRDSSIELLRVGLDGRAEQLTHSKPNVGNYHPTPSPDGKWILFGSNRTGTRQLYLARPDGTDVAPITRVPPGSAAMWAHWRPRN
jgi:Tol biopolymer transport system component